MELNKNKTTTTLRSLEEEWKQQGKTARQIARLRYYHKNKERILKERRSDPTLKYKRR